MTKRYKILGGLIGLGLIFGFFQVRTVAAAGATIYIAPNVGSYNVGSNFSVLAKINTGGVSINAAEATLVFNPNEISVLSVSKTGSVFNLWVQEPEFSNALGTVNFGGVIYNPGYVGASGTILTINFRVKAVGSSRLTLSAGAVLANDGSGTNILSSLGGASYIFRPTVAVPEDTTEEESLPAKTPASLPAVFPVFQVSSPTHPDGQHWYTNRNPEFTWTLPTNAENVSYLITEKATSNPGSDPDGLKDRIKFNDIADGVWYFHIKYRRNGAWSPILHFPFRIDATLPQAFQITRLDEDVPTNPRPLVLFNSSDATAGLKHYQLKIGNLAPVEIPPDQAGRPYALPELKPGNYRLVIQAVDLAGNETSASANIQVAALETPVIDSAEFSEDSQALSVQGRAKPNARVIVEIRKKTSWWSSASIARAAEDAPVQQVETVADEKGDWNVTVTDLAPGRYAVQAYIQDDKGATSEPTPPVSVGTTRFDLRNIGRTLSQILDWLIEALTGNFLLILSVVIILAALKLLFGNLFPILGREVSKWAFITREYRTHSGLQKTNRKVSLEVRMLINDVKKELALLKKIEQHRGLHADEQYLKQKLEKYLRLLS